MQMLFKFSTRTVSVVSAVVALAGAFWYLSQSHGLLADEQSAGVAASAVNVFHGTYAGGYWGTVTVPNHGPYGGDVKATISTTGAVSVTLPGAGTGTVSSTGVYNVTGKLKVGGVFANVSYTGKLVATRDPATGAVLSVVGNGTWVTTSTVTASGKWLVRRTLTTP